VLERPLWAVDLEVLREEDCRTTRSLDLSLSLARMDQHLRLRLPRHASSIAGCGVDGLVGVVCHVSAVQGNLDGTGTGYRSSG